MNKYQNELLFSSKVISGAKKTNPFILDDIKRIFDRCLNPERQTWNLFQTWIYHLGHADYSAVVFNNAERLVYF